MAAFMALSLPAQRYELSTTPQRLTCRATFGGFALRKAGAVTIRQRGGTLRALEGADGENASIVDVRPCRRTDLSPLSYICMF